MKRLLTTTAILALASPAFAQRAPDPNQTAQAVGALGRDTSTGAVCYVGVTATCAIPTTASGGASAATGANGATAPTSSNSTGFTNAAGNQTAASPSTPLPTTDVDQTGTGTLALATANATYVIPLTGGRATVGVRISGLTGSGATVTAERSTDGGTTWSNANTTASSATSSLSATITADDQFRIGAAGSTTLRLRVSTVGTGTASVAYAAESSAGAIFLTSLLPSTSNSVNGFVIGGVDNVRVAGTAISVNAGASDAGTQRVTLGSGTQTVGSIANTTFASTIAAGSDVTEGNITDTAFTGTGNATIASLLRGLYARTAIYTGYNELADSALGASASTAATQRTPPSGAKNFVCQTFSNQSGSLVITGNPAGSGAKVLVSVTFTGNSFTSYTLPLAGTGTGYLTCGINNGTTAATVSVQDAFQG